MIDGVINLDKPPGMSSARAVSQAKRLLPKGTKIGHAGTLDPFATGVLLLLIGKATRSSLLLMAEHKTYEATVKLGAITETLDPDSPEIPYQLQARDTPPTLDKIKSVIPAFVGSIQQRPPAFSALKVQGQRAYYLARRGKIVELESRAVHVYSIDVLSYGWPVVKLRIDCGRGTYIRSIARDLGAALNVGGYLTDLRRTRIGSYRIDNAIPLQRLIDEGIAPHLQNVCPST